MWQRKLRISLLLPVLHYLASVTIFGWRFWPRPVDATVTLWFAVNAPAVLLLDVTKRIATAGGCPPPIGYGERAFELLFFIGGLLIWFLVGLAVDNCRRPAMIDRPSTTALKTLVRLFFVLCGVRLIFYSKSMILPEYAGQRHPPSTLIAGFIVLLWSLVLIVGPVRTFISKKDSN
jgi:hypothetical protein